MQISKYKNLGSGWFSESTRHSNAKKFGIAGGLYAMKDWKFTQSAKNVNVFNDSWFMSWQKGREEIEIIRRYDEDNNKFGDYEVWNQTKMDDDSWKGENLDNFKKKSDAIKFAKKCVKEMYNNVDENGELYAKKKLVNKIEKITPQNYKKKGYQYYYKIGKKYRYSIETPDGHEIFYDENGKNIGEMS